MVRQRYAIFVDAGYIFAQGSLSFSSGKLTRSQLRLDEAEVMHQLRVITATPTSELLRVYWYDGTRGNMTVEQTTLAEMADVKMRLGYINGVGQQKGVDSLIVTDLIELARNQAIGDAYLVSGDGDLRVAVQIAQSFGVRVHLINLEPSKTSLNPQLRQEADTRQEIPKNQILKFLSLSAASGASIATVKPESEKTSVSPPAEYATAAPVTQKDISLTVEDATKQAIKAVFSDVHPVDVAKLKSAQTGKEIPAEYDRRVLGTARSLLGRDLTDFERKSMRKIVLSWLRHP